MREDYFTELNRHAMHYGMCDYKLLDISRETYIATLLSFFAAQFLISTIE